MSRTQKQTTWGAWLGPGLLAAFIAVPLAEIGLFIAIGGRIGVGWTLALIVLTAVLGAWMIRLQGFAVLARAQRALAGGELPVAEVFEGLCLLVAGALLVTPGFLTDFLGGLLLVPPLRALAYRQLRRRLDLRVTPAGPAGPRGPIVDGEFEELTDPPAPDAPGRAPPRDAPTPPPRGGWGRRS
jgi:UPF0716 protein FxsA